MSPLGGVTTAKFSVKCKLENSITPGVAQQSLDNVSGVYCIKCTETGRLYIGPQ